jgi:hypothetical protein
MLKKKTLLVDFAAAAAVVEPAVQSQHSPLRLTDMELLDSEQIVRQYIAGTHGSLPTIDYLAVGRLLSDDFQFTNEEQVHDKSALLGYVFPGRFPSPLLSTFMIPNSGSLFTLKVGHRLLKAEARLLYTRCVLIGPQTPF